MSEWIPVFTGAVLSMLHHRFRWSLRAVLWCALLLAAAATTLSGEVVHAPVLIVVDASLVAVGFAAARWGRTAWVLLRARQYTRTRQLRTTRIAPRRRAADPSG